MPQSEPPSAHYKPDPNPNPTPTLSPTQNIEPPPPHEPMRAFPPTTHQIFVRLLKQPVHVLDSLGLVYGGGVPKRPDGAVAALDAQKLVCEQRPGLVLGVVSGLG